MTQESDGGRPDQGPVTIDDRGTWMYPSAAHVGMVSVEIPLKNPDSFRKTESILACNFGQHVVAKTESEFKKLHAIQYRGFKPSDPAATFAHYTGAARGLGILEEKTVSQMERLSRQLAVAGDPEKFFAETVRPFLVNLRPGRR